MLLSYQMLKHLSCIDDWRFGIYWAENADPVYLEQCPVAARNSETATSRPLSISRWFYGSTRSDGHMINGRYLRPMISPTRTYASWRGGKVDRMSAYCSTLFPCLILNCRTIANLRLGFTVSHTVSVYHTARSALP